MIGALVIGVAILAYQAGRWIKASDWTAANERDLIEIEDLRRRLQATEAIRKEPARRREEAPGRDYRKERDAAYAERNRVVAALARLVVQRGGRAWLAEHPPDPKWDPEWRTIVFIECSTGQLTFHLHDSDVTLFDGLPPGPNTWDQHTTAEKYERVARLGR